jgi:hypothetical protein
VSEPTLERRRVLRAGVVAAAALVVGEGRAASAALPPLKVRGDVRALTPWRGGWCALVAGSESADDRPANALYATTPDRSRWAHVSDVKARAPRPRLLDMTSSDGLVAAGSATRVRLGATVTTRAGEHVRLRTTLTTPMVLTSDDGTTWTTVALPSGAQGALTCIAAGRGRRLLAVGSRLLEPGVGEASGALAARSSDGGATWTWLPTTGLDFGEGHVTSLGFARGAYFATAATVSGSALFASRDGAGWTAEPVPHLTVAERLVVVSGRGDTLVLGAVTEAGARLWRSDTPGRWEETSPPVGFEPAGDARLSGGALLASGDVALVGSRAGTTRISRTR